MNQHTSFDIVDHRKIDEIQSEVTLYRHRKTGAEILSVTNDDTNKVFGIALRTPAHDSTGVAHILEHTVLCGSKKYPVKDPFNELMKGSVYTFLNAMTYSDKTIYPVASENLQDFYNLMDVYIDAVYFPRLQEEMFEQEGWHYELLAEDEPLRFKGVVFNEMKGVYSSPEANLYRALAHALTPNGNEGNDSGGHPSNIPDLTYQGLLDFHRRYYHPSNSRIFFYGDDDPAHRLERIDQTLNQFDRAEVDSAIVPQPHFQAPREARDVYMPNQEEPGCFAMSAWLLGDTSDPFLTASLKLLGFLLLSQPGAPLRRALLESGLGEDLIGSGMDTSSVQIEFSTGLKNVAPDDVEEVHALVRSTLEQIAAEGFSADAIEAAFNITEFGLRENNTGSSPRGLVLMLRALGHWLHDRDPFLPLEVRPLLKKLRAAADGNPRFFQDLLQTHVLDNPHYVALRVDPDTEAGPREAAAEQSRLEQAQAALRNGDAEALIKRTRDLQALQMATDPPEAVASIPRLSLSDLPREIRTIPERVEDQDDHTILRHDLHTNGVWYLDLAFDLDGVPPRLFPYLPLLARIFTEMDTAKRSYIELAEELGKKTGGIRYVIHTSTRRSGEDVARLILRGKCLVERADDFLGLLHEILRQPGLNQERFRQMVLEEKSAEESALVPSGHRLVKSRLKAGYSVAEALGEVLDGLSYVNWIRDLAERLESDWDQIAADLAELRELALHPRRLLVSSTIDAAAHDALEGPLADFLASLEGGEPPISRFGEHALGAFASPEALLAPAKVNYVGRILHLGDSYTWHGSHAVITRALGTGYLWDNVRVKGGAYGANCGIDRGQKTMLFTSYRDPNLAETLKAYREAATYLQNHPFSEAEVEQAVIGTIGSVDSYKLPDAKGYTAFMRHLIGITDEERQRSRDEILGTSVEDFRAFGDLLADAAKTERVAFVTHADRVDGCEMDKVTRTALF